MSPSDCFRKIHYKNLLATTVLSPSLVLPASGYWTYQTSNASIRLEKSFCKAYVDEKVSIFNKTILNIIHDFILHKTLLVDDKSPPMLNNKIKNPINKKKNKNAVLKHYRQNINKLQILNQLEPLQNF